MKKAFMPLALIMIVLLALIAAAFWYSQKESDNWPFASQHHH
ncbi:MAG: hypothetical protein WCH84_07815 [Verrucomicrobiota bacterium]